MLVASTPETTNPVSDQCEVNGTPCISQRVPVAAVVLRRGGKPDTGFKSTYHFFWGLEDIIGVFVDMWDSIADQQGGRRAVAERRRRQRVGRQGARLPARAGQGRLQAGRSRPLPEPDRRLLRADLRLQDARRSRSSPACRSRRTGRRSGSRPPSRASSPKVATVGKALLFPRSVEALGHARRPACPPRCGGRRSIPSSRRSPAPAPASWPPPTRRRPRSSGRSRSASSTRSFEVGLDSLKRADERGRQEPRSSPPSRPPTSTRSWDRSAGPRARCPTSPRRPLVGGQWVQGQGASPSTWSIVSNKAAPNIPVGGKLAAARAGGDDPPAVT